jgi:hypothetical protein
VSYYENFISIALLKSSTLDGFDMINVLPKDNPVAKAIEIRDWVQSQPWSDLVHVSAEEESLNKVYNFSVPIHTHWHIYLLYQCRWSLRSLLKNCRLPQESLKLIPETTLF